jgi:hypothetical protein
VKESPILAHMAGRSQRDLMIIRLERKKDHRELQVTKGGLFNYKAGLDKDVTPAITVTVVSEGIFAVRPDQDLKPGEYLITFNPQGSNGEDFGIR